MDRETDATFSKRCEDVHRLLLSLPLFTEPSDALPKDGLYFFYERGETNAHDGGPRIVRVGNHPRSTGRLMARLRQHYSGNKNSSVFRRHLGGAILRRRDANHPCLRPSPGKGHWEKQGERTCEVCRSVEEEVSSLLQDSLAFRTVEIEDIRFRNLMEGKLIGILSSCPECVASSEWLGRFAYNERVRSSGMWNSDHVGGRVGLTPEERRRLTMAVEDTLEGADEEGIAAILGFSLFHDLDNLLWLL